MTADEELQIEATLRVAELLGDDASPQLQRYAKHVRLLHDHVVHLREIITAEREQWNQIVGAVHPPEAPPLSASEFRLMKAIFASD